MKGLGDFDFFVGTWDGIQRRLLKPLAECSEPTVSVQLDPEDTRFAFRNVPVGWELRRGRREETHLRLLTSLDASDRGGKGPLGGCGWLAR